MCYSLMAGILNLFMEIDGFLICYKELSVWMFLLKCLFISRLGAVVTLSRKRDSQSITTNTNH